MEEPCPIAAEPRRLRDAPVARMCSQVGLEMRGGEDRGKRSPVARVEH